MTNPLLTTPRALKTAKPAHVPNTTAGITYTEQQILGNSTTGALNQKDRRRIATTSHKSHVVLAVGSAAAVLTPLQAEQAAAALQRHAKIARAQRRNGAR